MIMDTTMDKRGAAIRVQSELVRRARTRDLYRCYAGVFAVTGFYVMLNNTQVDLYNMVHWH